MSKEVSFKIKIDGKELDLAKTSVNEFNNAYTEASQKLNDLPLNSPEWAKLNGELKGAQTSFEQTKEIVGTVDAKFKSLRVQLRQATLAFQEAEEKGDLQGMKKAKQTIDDVSDALEISQLKAMKFTDALATLPGALGFVGQSIQGVDRGLKLLSANPAIAIISVAVGALTLLFKGLQESLSRTEEGKKKLAKVAEIFERILNGLFAILEPLANMFIDFAISILGSTESMQGFGKVVAIVSGVLAGTFQIIKTLTMFVVNNLITAFKTATGVISGFGDVIAGVFTFDLDRIKKGVETVKNTVVQSFKDTKENVVNTVKGFMDVTNAYQNAYDSALKSYNEGLSRRKKAEGKTAEEIKKIKQDEINAEYELQKAKDNLAEAQRVKDKDRIKELQNQQDFLKKRFNADVKRIDDLMKLEKKGSNEYKALQAQKLAIDEKYTKDSEAFAKQLTDIKKEEYQKDLDNYKESIKNLERARQEAFTKELNELNNQLAKGEITQLEFNIKQVALNKKQADEKYKNLLDDYQRDKNFQEFQLQQGLISQQEYNKNIDAINMEFDAKEFETRTAANQARVEEEKTLAQILTETKTAETNAIIALEQSKLDAVATIGGIISQLAGENKALAITGLLVEQGAAVANVLVNAARTKSNLLKQSAIYTSLIPNPVTAAIGIAGVAATKAGLATNTISTITSLASIGAAIGQGIAQISSQGSSQKSGGENMGKNYERGGIIKGRRHAQGGTIIEAEDGEAIMTRGAVTMFRPMLSMMNQMGGGTSFNSNIMSRPDAPSVSTPSEAQGSTIMKTYVVSNELTTESEKQARLKDLSTL